MARYPHDEEDVESRLCLHKSWSLLKPAPPGSAQSVATRGPCIGSLGRWLAILLTSAFRYLLATGFCWAPVINPLLAICAGLLKLVWQRHWRIREIAGSYYNWHRHQSTFTNSARIRSHTVRFNGSLQCCFFHSLHCKSRLVEDSGVNPS